MLQVLFRILQEDFMQVSSLILVECCLFLVMTVLAVSFGMGFLVNFVGSIEITQGTQCVSYTNIGG